MKNLLSQNAFWVVNKKLAKAIGLEAAFLLSDLITKEEYFAQKGQVNDDGWFFNTAENIEEDTMLSYYKQKKALKILEDFGFIETKLIGLPAKLHFKIIESQILNFFNTEIEKNSNLYNKNKPNKNKEKESPEILFPVQTAKKQKKNKSLSSAGNSGGGKLHETKEMFNIYKNIFEAFYYKHTGQDYYFTAKDAGKIYPLIKKIRHAWESKGTIPNQKQMEKGFEHLLYLAVQDKWLSNNLSLSNIDSKFNEIKSKNNGKQIDKDKQLFNNVLKQINEEF